ncbi:hypothetical protein YPPY34_4884, partial [Yersinia pestis PY-34]|jgi:DNA repair protein RadC
MLD